MSRHVYDDEFHAHFITFSCYRRRRLLDHDRTKQIVVDVLAGQLAKQGSRCLGFVVMPDHVHALLWFPQTGQLSSLMKQWKQRSSFHIKAFVRESMHRYASTFAATEPVWQPRYYDFNVYSEKILLQKVQYMHENPVRAGMADSPCAWVFSSARWYDRGDCVGVPIGF